MKIFFKKEYLSVSMAIERKSGEIYAFGIGWFHPKNVKLWGLFTDEYDGIKLFSLRLGPFFFSSC